MRENEVSRRVIGAAIEGHKVLGPRLLESAYQTSLERELQLQGMKVQRQLGLPLIYKDVECDVGYRLDLLVENKVVVEIKSVEALNDVYVAQLLTYLKRSNRRLGLLSNFNLALLKDGIRRIVNNLKE